MKSQLRDNQMDTDTHQTTTTMTTTTNNFAMDQLEELYETVRILSSGAQTLDEDRQRLNSELLEHRTKLQSLTDNASQVQVAVEEENALQEEMTRNLEILNQDVISLKEKMDDMQYISYDGTFTWKITNFQEKMSKQKVFFIAHSLGK
jgi:chromosome segregation ATPase